MRRKQLRTGSASPDPAQHKDDAGGELLGSPNSAGNAEDAMDCEPPGADSMDTILQTCSDMHRSDNVQKAGCATTPGESWSVGLLHILQVVQVQTDLK